MDSSLTMKPLVTVLMPVYNGEKYLKDAIQSILQQTYTNFELLIINDGSTDTSVAIIKSFTDPRIRLLENPTNLGFAATLNRGIKESQGIYIARIDADDIAMPLRLQKQVAYLDNHADVGLIGSAASVIDETDKLNGVTWRSNASSEEIPVILLFHNYFTHSSVMVRKNALPEDGYRNEFRPAEDYDLWIRIAQKWKLKNLPEVLVHYRINTLGMTQTEDSAKSLHVNEIVTRELQTLGITPSPEELTIHRTNFGYTGLHIHEFVQNRIAWFQKLVASNNQTKLFPQGTFKKVLIKKLFMTLWANRKKGVLYSPSLVGSIVKFTLFS